MSQAAFEIQLIPSKSYKRNSVDDELSLNQIRFLSPKHSTIKTPKKQLSNSHNTYAFRRSPKIQEARSNSNNEINKSNQFNKPNLSQTTKRKVKFLPDNRIVTIINIESYKKYNSEQTVRNPIDISPVKCNCEIF